MQMKKKIQFVMILACLGICAKVTCIDPVAPIGPVARIGEPKSLFQTLLGTGPCDYDEIVSKVQNGCLLSPQPPQFVDYVNWFKAIAEKAKEGNKAAQAFVESRGLYSNKGAIEALKQKATEGSQIANDLIQTRAGLEYEDFVFMCRQSRIIETLIPLLGNIVDPHRVVCLGSRKNKVIMTARPNQKLELGIPETESAQIDGIMYFDNLKHYIPSDMYLTFENGVIYLDPCDVEPETGLPVLHSSVWRTKRSVKFPCKRLPGLQCVGQYTADGFRVNRNGVITDSSRNPLGVIGVRFDEDLTSGLKDNLTGEIHKWKSQPVQASLPQSTTARDVNAATQVVDVSAVPTVTTVNADSTATSQPVQPVQASLPQSTTAGDVNAAPQVVDVSAVPTVTTVNAAPQVAVVNVDTTADTFAELRSVRNPKRRRGSSQTRVQRPARNRANKPRSNGLTRLQSRKSRGNSSSGRRVRAIRNSKTYLSLVS